MQVAVSAQEAVERAVLGLAALARELTGSENLCLAGGVALNCKANGLLQGPVFAPPDRRTTPAPRSARRGTWRRRAGAPAQGRTQRHGRISAFLGPSPGAAAQANGALDGLHREPLSLERVCAALEAGRIGAIVEGPGEVGPRALGHRSIVADPSVPGMHDRLNALKGREPWRPFGAAALSSRAAALWQPRPRLSDYMLAGTPVSDAGRDQLPAAVHVDGTTRPQELDPAVRRPAGRAAARVGASGRAARSSTRRSTGAASRSCRASPTRRGAFRRLGLDFLVLDDELVAHDAALVAPGLTASRTSVRRRFRALTGGGTHPPCASC